MGYRLYCLDQTGHIVSGRDLSAHDDLAALREAEAACTEHSVEVWHGARRVARVKLGNIPLGPSDRTAL